MIFIFQVTANFKAVPRKCSFVDVEYLGKVTRTGCTTKCLLKDRCYLASFLPEDGSTKLGICILQLTYGDQISTYKNTDGWQHYGMYGRKCYD